MKLEAECFMSFYTSWRLPGNIVFLSVPITVFRTFCKGDAEGLFLLRAPFTWRVMRRRNVQLISSHYEHERGSGAFGLTYCRCIKQLLAHRN